jgi:hypothetical protein
MAQLSTPGATERASIELHSIGDARIGRLGKGKCSYSCRPGWRSRLTFDRAAASSYVRLNRATRPTGLSGTDAICAEVIARGGGEAAGALVVPTIAIWMAQHHLGFAGSYLDRGAARPG